MGKAWGGRFEGGTDRRVEIFTESISFDHRLFREDIAGSIAHATMLGEVGVLTADEALSTCEELHRIEEMIEAGQMQFDPALEDIHLHIETELIRRLGDVGRKLHTGRSRNDQTATDFRLWVRRHLDLLDDRLRGVQQSLTAAADRQCEVVLPAYTHLQRAQPVLAGHYFLAYVEKFQRDRQRTADCRRRVNVSPLGSAAVAGTSLPINRSRTAELLGFESVSANSIDAVSDRDFVLETAFVLAVVAEHLSGWAEEWILWSTVEFGFLRLPDAFCTGSSIMPQKKNPDVLEIIRGKTGRVLGSLQGLMVLMKGLPLAYNRDLQEDKPMLFDAVDQVLSCLEMAAVMIDGAEIDERRVAERLDRGFLDATSLMEKAIECGVPMRSAHEIVGQLVKRAEAENRTLADLPAETFDAAAPGRAAELRAALSPASAVGGYRAFGSSAPHLVREQLQLWKQRLAGDRVS